MEHHPWPQHMPNRHLQHICFFLISPCLTLQLVQIKRSNVGPFVQLQHLPKENWQRFDNWNHSSMWLLRMQTFEREEEMTRLQLFKPIVSWKHSVDCTHPCLSVQLYDCWVSFMKSPECNSPAVAYAIWCRQNSVAWIHASCPEQLYDHQLSYIVMGATPLQLHTPKGSWQHLEDWFFACCDYHMCRIIRHFWDEATNMGSPTFERGVGVTCLQLNTPKQCWIEPVAWMHSSHPAQQYDSPVS